MPAGSNKNVAFIAVIAVLIPCLIALWFALPMFLPMFLWTKVDLAAIAASKNVPQSKLETKFKLSVRYHPRGEGDPLPWQIIDSTPPWIKPKIGRGRKRRAGASKSSRHSSSRR